MSYKSIGSKRYKSQMNCGQVDDNLLRAICLCAARVQIEKEKNANDQES